LVLDRHVLPTLGRAQRGEITHDDVQAWVNQLAERFAPSTVQRSFTLLRQVLELAVDNRLIATNPSDRTAMPRRQQFEARFLTPDELELLADTIHADSRAMVLLMAWATLRIGEALGLRRLDLDLKARRMRIANNLVEVAGRRYEGSPKTKAGRRSMSVPSSVVADLRVHVARHRDDPDVVMAPGGGLWSAEDLADSYLATGCSTCAPRTTTSHDLKHTGVALLAAAGVDPSEIARRAGHSSASFTYDRYGHLFPEVDHAAAAKLDAIRTVGLGVTDNATTAS